MYIQISRALVLHLTHIALAHVAKLGSDYYKKASVVKGQSVYKAVWTTCTRANAMWILRHLIEPPHLIDPAFNRGPAFISRTSVLTPGVY